MYRLGLYPYKEQDEMLARASGANLTMKGSIELSPIATAGKKTDYSAMFPRLTSKRKSVDLVSAEDARLAAPGVMDAVMEEAKGAATAASSSGPTESEALRMQLKALQQQMDAMQPQFDSAGSAKSKGSSKRNSPDKDSDEAERKAKRARLDAISKIGIL